MHLSGEDIAVLLLSLGIILALARILGEIAQRFNQPAVVGEIVAGIILGPTVLGLVSPEWNAFLFPVEGPRALEVEGLATLGITLFLLVAGMEVDLSSIWRQGRTVAYVGFAGLVVPLGLAFLVAWLFPDALGRVPDEDRFIFSLFFATALSISALPVVSKMLMDLNLFQTDLGMVVTAAAILNDIAGWVLFALILGMMGLPSTLGLSVAGTIGVTLGFVAVMLTLGRWLVNLVLPFIQAHTSWPSGILGFAIASSFVCAAFTEAVGVHAILGAFFLGVCIGDSPHLRQHTRRVINDFIQSIFAPLFFGSIGLTFNFAAHFDLKLVVIVLVLACVGKLAGCLLGAKAGGTSYREAWAIGFGMNARGAMEVILGLLALENHLISERLFVALVVMALGTSVISGPAMKRILRHRKPRAVLDHLTAKTFVASLKSTTSQAAIHELAQAVANTVNLPLETIERAVWHREETLPTAIGNAVAVPHARMAGITAPTIGVGLSSSGIDFNAPDGQPVRVVFFVITPEQDSGAQLEILANISRTFLDPKFVDKVLQTSNYTQFRALLRTANDGQGH